MIPSVSVPPSARLHRRWRQTSCRPMRTRQSPPQRVREEQHRSAGFSTAGTLKTVCFNRAVFGLHLLRPLKAANCLASTSSPSSDRRRARSTAFAQCDLPCRPSVRLHVTLLAAIAAFATALRAFGLTRRPDRLCRRPFFYFALNKLKFDPARLQSTARLEPANNKQISAAVGRTFVNIIIANLPRSRHGHFALQPRALRALASKLSAKRPSVSKLRRRP